MSNINIFQPFQDMKRVSETQLKVFESSNLLIDIMH